ncbi:MAG: alanine:cation symporter family protein, partial [Planctomycetota bacterium]
GPILAALGKVLSVVFAVICIGASFGGGNSYQINQSLAAISQNVTFFQENGWVYGLIMAGMVAAVIIGGIKSIGAVASKVVPSMCLLYMLVSLAILGLNVFKIPDAIGLIFQGAFSPDAIYGGAVGVLILGVKRAVFSNEAGVGSAAIAHSAAKTDEPVSEGIVALLEPFIDTVVVCTTTALVIIVTGVYQGDQNGLIIVKEEGAALTLAAFNSVSPYAGYLLSVAVVLFAFSTCISWSYYGERSFVQLFGEKSSIIYKVLFVIATFLGAVITAKNVLVFSDLMILGLSFPNLLGVFILSGVVKRELDKYWAKYKSGELKRFG